MGDFPKRSLMILSFTPLEEQHFPLLCKWLQTPHVKKWWDSHISWNMEKVQEKYDSYTQGFKMENKVRKAIYPYIILCDETPIGYIQFYDAYDFVREVPLKNLPPSLAALDFYIGEESYLGKGLGAKILLQFIKQYLKKKFQYVFVDPDINNYAAIKTYENAGFCKVENTANNKFIWMLRKVNNELP